MSNSAKLTQRLEAGLDTPPPISVKGLDGLPKVRQLYYFSVLPSNIFTAARCAVSKRGHKMSRPIKNQSSRQYLSRLITCVEVAARNRSYVLRMRRKAIVRPEAMVASINLNMMAGLAMLSIPRGWYKRCCANRELVSD